MITASGVHPKPAKVEGRKLSATAKSAEVLILPCAAQIARGSMSLPHNSTGPTGHLRHTRQQFTVPTSRV